MSMATAIAVVTGVYVLITSHRRDRALKLRWDVRYYIVILYFLNGYLASTVIWQRKTDPIVFGNDVSLKCFLPENFNKYYPRQWKRGGDILIYDEATSEENRNKYGGSLEDDGFTLIIKDFQSEDFRRNYTCSYLFDVYTSNLNTENYQCLPERDSYNVDVNSSLSQVEVNVTFQKIYPIPQCKIYLHNRELESESVNTSHVVDTYCLGLTMTLSYEYGMFDCGKEASVSCSVGNRSIPLTNINVTRTCEVVCLQMSPCLNNGTCMHDRMNVSCNCTEGYYGQRCENVENQTTMTSTDMDSSTGSLSATTIAIIIIILLVLVIVPVICLVKWRLRTSTEIRKNEGTDVAYNGAVAVNGTLFEQESSTLMMEGPGNHQD